MRPQQPLTSRASEKPMLVYLLMLCPLAKLSWACDPDISLQLSLQHSSMLVSLMSLHGCNIFLPSESERSRRKSRKQPLWQQTRLRDWSLNTARAGVYMSDWRATVIPLLPSVFSINQESSILFCSRCTGLPRIFPLTFTGNASIEKTWKNADLISHTESQTPRDVRHIFSRVGSYVCSYKPSRGLFPELSGQQIPEGSSPAWAQQPEGEEE